MVAIADQDEAPMSHEDAGRLVDLLAAAYPRSPVRITAVELFARAFADLDYGEVRDAIVEHVRSSCCWPLVVDIREIAMRRRGRAMRHPLDGLN